MIKYKKGRFIEGIIKKVEHIPAEIDKENNEITPSYLSLYIETLSYESDKDNLLILKYDGMIGNTSHNKKYAFTIDGENTILEIRNIVPTIIPLSYYAFAPIVIIKCILYYTFFISIFIGSYVLLTGVIDGWEEALSQLAMIALVPFTMFPFESVFDWFLGLIPILSFLYFPYIMLKAVKEGIKDGDIVCVKTKGIPLFYKIFRAFRNL